MLAGWVHQKPQVDGHTALAATPEAVIAYFDTSAVMPLLIAEGGSARAASLWDGADRVVSVRLVYLAGDGALLEGAAAEGLAVAELP